MSTTISGTVFGDTIKLDARLDMLPGQKVEVVVRPTQDLRDWGAGLLRCAGALADFPEMDAELEKIYQDRQATQYREETL